MRTIFLLALSHLGEDIGFWPQSAWFESKSAIHLFTEGSSRGRTLGTQKPRFDSLPLSQRDER